MKKYLHTVSEDLGVSTNDIIGILKKNGIDVKNSINTPISEDAYAVIINTLESYNDVEEEDNSNVIIEIPFNPNDIRVRTEPHNIGQLIDRLEFDELNLNTDFQRLPNLWDDTKKSKFIESLILKLPIPTFYFAENDEDKKIWDVVDGLQRVSTLKHFIIDKTEKKLRLTNLEFLKEYNGQTYDELPRDLKRRIKTFTITIYIIEQGTPDIVKFNIFSRINQGGLILTPQEIRHAIHQGVSSNLIADLVRDVDVVNGNKPTKFATEAGKAFVMATESKIKSDRMQDRDFANRFVAFYLISYKEYQPDLDSFMNKGLSAVKVLSKDKLEKLKSDFTAAMILAKDIFENDAFRKRFYLEDRRKPINKALFETLSVNFAKLNNENRDLLKKRKNIFKEKLRELHNKENKKFLNSISQGTALKGSVSQRFTDIKLIIKETLQND
jgi:hypothetical protein